MVHPDPSNCAVASGVLLDRVLDMHRVASIRQVDHVALADLLGEDLVADLLDPYRVVEDRNLEDPLEGLRGPSVPYLDEEGMEAGSCAACDEVLLDDRADREAAQEVPGPCVEDLPSSHRRGPSYRDAFDLPFQALPNRRVQVLRDAVNWMKAVYSFEPSTK